MNARYVEAMARATAKRSLRFGDFDAMGTSAQAVYRAAATDSLTALIATLRADPIAADLLATGNISHTGADLLARLCDYLEAS